LLLHNRLLQILSATFGARRAHRPNHAAKSGGCTGANARWGCFFARGNAEHILMKQAERIRKNGF
jgi:hypothetical protein